MNSRIKLRDYQTECISIIEKCGRGRHLVQMATGLGKTVTFANIPRKGRMLILSHREELVRQPLKYFDCTAGVEMADNSTAGTEEVVSASVRTMAHRLDCFSPDDFDIIIPKVSSGGERSLTGRITFQRCAAAGHRRRS